MVETAICGTDTGSLGDHPLQPPPSYRTLSRYLLTCTASVVITSRCCLQALVWVYIKRMTVVTAQAQPRSDSCCFHITAAIYSQLTDLLPAAQYHRPPALDTSTEGVLVELQSHVRQCFHQLMLSLANSTHASGHTASALAAYEFLQFVSELTSGWRDNDELFLYRTQAAAGISLCYRSQCDPRVIDTTTQLLRELELVVTSKVRSGTFVSFSCFMLCEQGAKCASTLLRQLADASIVDSSPELFSTMQRYIDVMLRIISVLVRFVAPNEQQIQHAERQKASLSYNRARYHMVRQEWTHALELLSPLLSNTYAADDHGYIAAMRARALATLHRYPEAYAAARHARSLAKAAGQTPSEVQLLSLMSFLATRIDTPAASKYQRLAQLVARTIPDSASLGPELDCVNVRFWLEADNAESILQAHDLVRRRLRGLRPAALHAIHADLYHEWLSLEASCVAALARINPAHHKEDAIKKCGKIIDRLAAHRPASTEPYGRVLRLFVILLSDTTTPDRIALRSYERQLTSYRQKWAWTALALLHIMTGRGTEDDLCVLFNAYNDREAEWHDLSEQEHQISLGNDICEHLAEVVYALCLHPLATPRNLSTHAEQQCRALYYADRMKNLHTLSLLRRLHPFPDWYLSAVPVAESAFHTATSALVTDLNVTLVQYLLINEPHYHWCLYTWLVKPDGSVGFLRSKLDTALNADPGQGMIKLQTIMRLFRDTIGERAPNMQKRIQRMQMAEDNDDCTCCTRCSLLPSVKQASCRSNRPRQSKPLCLCPILSSRACLSLRSNRGPRATSSSIFVMSAPRLLSVCCISWPTVDQSGCS